MPSPQTLPTLTDLGINIFELAETAKRLGKLAPDRIEAILATADKRIKIQASTLNPIVEDLCYDEHFLARAGIPYENPDSRLIKAAIAQYLLMHQN